MRVCGVVGIVVGAVVVAAIGVLGELTAGVVGSTVGGSDHEGLVDASSEGYRLGELLVVSNSAVGGSVTGDTSVGIIEGVLLGVLDTTITDGCCCATTEGWKLFVLGLGLGLGCGCKEGTMEGMEGSREEGSIVIEGSFVENVSFISTVVAVVSLTRAAASSRVRVRRLLPSAVSPFVEAKGCCGYCRKRKRR